MQNIAKRVSHIENHMGEFGETLNELVDAHNNRDKELEWLKVKMANLEDCSRGNNVKIQGIPKTIQSANL